MPNICDMYGLTFKRNWDMANYMSLISRNGKYGEVMDVTLPTIEVDGKVVNLRIPTDGDYKRWVGFAQK